MRPRFIIRIAASIVCLVVANAVQAVEFQPLRANVGRVLEALEFLGTPLPPDVLSKIERATQARDAEALQAALAPQVLLEGTIRSDELVETRLGQAPAKLQQAGYTPVLIRGANPAHLSSALRLTSPDAGPRYAGMTTLSAQRMQRTHLEETQEKTARPERFLALELYTSAPLKPELSGLDVEYLLGLVYSSASGTRTTRIALSLAKAEKQADGVPVSFEIRPAVPVRLRVEDSDGKPATARFTFRDAAGHVYPPQANRLAPDLYFQRQIYRRDGEEVLLPPGRLTMIYTRGPEYRTLQREITIPREGSAEISVRLERWIDPAAHGFFSGDHHIHGAGCAHYTSPTEGVKPDDMMRQVEGEGLNVGCVLTWGPCFEYQRNFFSPKVDRLSQPLTLLKYDIEISGFGSEALGHVCLLNLTDQTFPGSDGTKTKGWPKWTTPVLRWAKQQGAVTGYAHSASGLEVAPAAASKRLLDRYDTDHDGQLTTSETANAILPFSLPEMDRDRNAGISEAEMVAAHEHAAIALPNFAVPEMNGVGAMEVCVSVAEGVCDFISSMDTARIAEWNMWYHILNCGFSLKTSGETDFPCISGERVGQGRGYVQLGRRSQIEYKDWCEELARGRSYVSDGFAHALGFTVNGVAPGFGSVELSAPGRVQVRALVAFAPETPRTVAQGTLVPPDGRQFIGDVVNLHGPRTDDAVVGGFRQVEIVLNGQPVASREVPADGQTHALEFEIEVGRSSWVALRQFPQLHTNPVDVFVGGRPIRASGRSALWCVETIEQLWRNRSARLPDHERDAAKETFDRAIETYRRIAREASSGH